MKPIFTRTLERCIRPAAIIFTVLVAFISSAVVGNSAINTGSVSFDSLMSKALLYQHLIVFFAVSDLLIMVLIASNASGIIANEIHEGTFRLLAAKPNDRRVILLAKILGTLAATTILYLVALLGYYVGLLTFDLDADIYKGLITYLPSYLVYGIILIFVLTGITTLLSCIFKKKIGAMLPILLILVVILGFFPIYRTVGTIGMSNADNSKIVWIDLNYHFSLIFKSCVNLCGSFEVGSALQVSVVNILTNLFTSEALDRDVIRTYYSSGITTFNNALNGYLVMIAYLVIAAGCYIGSFVIIKHKDV